MFYLIKLGAMAAVTVALSALTILVGVFDRHGKRVYGMNRFWTWLILKLGGVTLRVSGLNHLDPKREYLFVVNHQSNVDIPVLVQALAKFQLRWIAKRELLWVPFLGWAMWAAKHITVDRTDSLDAIKSLAVAKQRIAAGISVVVFPEGTRSTDGKLLPFKRGGLFLALKTKTPIVPVTIKGTGKLLPKGAWRLQRGQVSVEVGAPISTETRQPGGLRALSARIHQLIAINLSAGDRPHESEQKIAQPQVAAHGRTV